MSTTRSTRCCVRFLVVASEVGITVDLGMTSRPVFSLPSSQHRPGRRGEGARRCAEQYAQDEKRVNSPNFWTGKCQVSRGPKNNRPAVRLLKSWKVGRRKRHRWPPVGIDVYVVTPHETGLDLAGIGLA